MPFIKGGLAYLDCKIFHRCELPKSIAMIGEVVAGARGAAGKPLVCLNCNYVRIKE